MQAAYPEIFAASSIGGRRRDDGLHLHSGTGKARTRVLGSNDRATGRAETRDPFLSIAATTDPLGEGKSLGGCTRRAFSAAMITNNRIDGLRDAQGVDVDRYKLDLSSMVTGRQLGGYRWTKYVRRDTAGCRIGERRVVDGIGHTWPGGDPKHSHNIDLKGPDAAKILWDFLSRYRK